MKWGISGSIHFDIGGYQISGWVNLDEVSISGLGPDKTLYKSYFIWFF